MHKRAKPHEVPEKIYRQLLRLYPRSHRQEYGALMAQLFRDQCRDVGLEGGSDGWMKFWLRVLLDIGWTSALEQIAAIERKPIMNHIKNTPTILLLIGIASGILSVPLLSSAAPLSLLLISVSSFAIFIRAGLELFRPSGEWKRIVLGTVVLMFIYSLLMPAWAKSGVSGTLPPWASFLSAIILIGFFANPVVTIIKFLQFLAERRKV